MAMLLILVALPAAPASVEAGPYIEGDFIEITPILSFSVLIGASALAFFPETKQRELEAIS